MPMGNELKCMAPKKEECVYFQELWNTPTSHTVSLVLVTIRTAIRAPPQWRWSLELRVLFLFQRGQHPLGFHLFFRGRLSVRPVRPIFALLCTCANGSNLSAILTYASACCNWDFSTKMTGRASKEVSKTWAKRCCVSATLIRRHLSKQGTLKGLKYFFYPNKLPLWIVGTLKPHTSESDFS